MTKEPLILAVETSIAQGSLSILRGGVLLASRTFGREVVASQELISLISDLLGDQNLTLKRVELIAVSTGPGSFTGIRVGMATGLALATGLRRRCVSVSLLEALAFSAGAGSDVLAVVPSGNTQVFWQLFRVGEHRAVGGGDIQQSGFQLLTDFIESHLNKSELRLVAEASVYSFLKSASPKLMSEFNCLKASDNAAVIIGKTAHLMISIPTPEPLFLSTQYPE